jgi:iron complex transport system substrate-binding protein
LNGIRVRAPRHTHGDYSPALPPTRSSRLLFSICAAIWASCAGAASISVTDDAGRRVELQEPARRIVTLAPFLTELVYSAGAGSRLVGASAYSDYPPEARALPRVASAMAPEVEAIAALKPELVLAWRDSIRGEDIDRIARLGIAVHVSQPRRLDDVVRVLESIGLMAGVDASGPAARYRASLARLRAAHAGKPRVRTFVEIWHRPLTTVAGRHWINESLELCGAENVFGDLAEVAPVVSWEELYARDPRLVVGAGSAGGEASFRASWSERAGLAAVKAQRLAWIDADTLQRPTLRLAEGVGALCAAVERGR